MAFGGIGLPSRRQSCPLPCPYLVAALKIKVRRTQPGDHEMRVSAMASPRDTLQGVVVGGPLQGGRRARRPRPCAVVMRHARRAANSLVAAFIRRPTASEQRRLHTRRFSV